MAIAGSSQTSIHLELIGADLVETAVMARQRSICCASAAEAWATLTHAGRCNMLLAGSNLADLRALYRAWAFGQVDI